MSFTAAQRQAIDARGNVVVVAGAGTGKTRTLITRALERICDPAENLSLDEILMVTFTDAAAAGMRQRIREALEQRITAQPENQRLSAQLALLDTAHISTIHSFCLQLIRQHFFELGLDPQISVLTEEQSQLLAADTLDTLFESYYEGQVDHATAVLEVLHNLDRGRERLLRELVLALHHHTQTRPDPEGWLQRQVEAFAQDGIGQWLQWLVEGFETWRKAWLPILQAKAAENCVATWCVEALNKVPSALPSPADSKAIAEQRRHIVSVLDGVLDARANCPKGKKGKLCDPIEKIFDEAEYLKSVAAVEGGKDPLEEDWSWVREQMSALIKVAQEFARDFAAAKRRAGQVDFHDLEQMALQLLWDNIAQTPTPLAKQWRKKFKYVFVDEYQDINAAQDRLLTALSGEGADVNRFLVGDFKQSIYRFRQAEPAIFQHYAYRWQEGSPSHSVVHLSDNFRSHESLLNFINPLFATLMTKELGGVEYDQQAQLRFGDSPERQLYRIQGDRAADPRVEILLHLQQGETAASEGEDSTDAAWAALSHTEREAHHLALRLRQLKEVGYEIRDGGQLRPVDWKDMVVLLRSASRKVESYAKEFARVGVPLQAKRLGFFESIEVADLINLLTLLDNPLQDIPALAVLRSPLVGLTIDELALVRMAQPRTPFWIALRHFQNKGNATDQAETKHKIASFLERFAHWRSLSRHASLAQRLEGILTETHYLDWLASQPRGKQAQANVQQLISLARQFDEVQHHSLYRFLNFLELQQELVGDREPAPLETENAVRLMTIHQSKGLEFPVVAVADLGKPFNTSDQNAYVILDDHYGLCSRIKPPGLGQHYPGLPHWLAQRRQQREASGEEIRILYVALTRAQDTLILSGTTNEKNIAEKWPEKKSSPPSGHDLLAAHSYLDWLGPWLAGQAPASWAQQEEGTTELWRWRLLRATAPSGAAEKPQGPSPILIPALSTESLQQLQARMTWTYPHSHAVTEAAKTSVSTLRQRAQATDESALAPFLRQEPKGRRGDAKTRTLTAADIGTVHHTFLQLVAPGRVGTLADLEAEAARLHKSHVFTDAEYKSLNCQRIFEFWQSSTGQKILAQTDALQRELPFTIRLSRADLEQLHVPGLPVTDEEDFIVVQGVMDSVVFLPDEIWLLDYKTDDVVASDLEERAKHYAVQMKLYAHALGVIYERPVTHRWLHFLAVNRTVEV